MSKIDDGGLKGSDILQKQLNYHNLSKILDDDVSEYEKCYGRTLAQYISENSLNGAKND